MPFSAVPTPFVFKLGASTDT